MELSGLGASLPQGPYRSCQEWPEDTRTALDTNQFTFLIVLLWNAWNRRNRWVHEGQLIPSRLVVEYAQGRLAAVGVIARDHHGLMLDGTHSAEKVKACAFEEGVHMATMHGWQQVIVEGDTISTLNRLRAYDPDRSVAATNLAETTMLLRANTHISIGHVTRTVNRVAHTLAHSALSSPSDFIFDLDVPRFIFNDVIGDAIYG
ncbi:hypothetical protein V6N13_124481 [Hibiscus sabdariffa]